jgi:hypothetical protein
MSVKKRQPTQIGVSSQKWNARRYAGTQLSACPMQVIAASTRREFWERHADAEQVFEY